MNFRRIPTGVVALILLISATTAAADGPAKPAANVPAKNFTNSVDMQFIKIPAGEFQMGITENDAARLVQRGNVDWPLGDWEKQIHKVKLTKDYYIGKHKVTVGQFRKFVEATKYETNAEDGFNAVRTPVIEGAITVGIWRDPQFKQGEDHPVVCVTSVDAQKFIDWLNKTDKKKPEGCEYRLPTEAEWEYASRGAQGTKYPWGNEWAEQCAQPALEGHCFNLFKPEFLELRTLPVGSFSPKGDSSFGVSDMSGNVSEWCLDWYEDNYPKNDQVDPLGPVPGTISRNGIYASPYTEDEGSDLLIQQTMRSKVFKGDSWYDEHPVDAGKLPRLPGKAPVFCIVTKVDTASETYSDFLLFDGIVNTEKTVEDEQGVVKKRTTDRVMTSRDEEKSGRPLKGTVISTGGGIVIPRKQAMAELPGKLVLFCDDFEGLHPVYRKMLAQDTWIIEVEKPNGLGVERPSQQLEALKAETAVFAGPQELPEKAAADLGVGVKMELVLIPAGKFRMGSGESAKDTAAFFNKTYRENFPADGMGGLEANFFENEHPQHDVRITKPFYLGMYPVTRGQFKQFVADTAYKTDTEKDKKLLAWGWDPDKKEFSNDKKYSWQNTGFKQTDEHPVVNVTWNDAVVFCQWLSKKVGQTYRLPTEAEWEYACRAGTTTRYPSGDDPKTLGNVTDLADMVDAAVRAKMPDWKYMIRHSDNYVFTSPVGKSKPNAFGLHDMHGNAFQWCSDWYGDQYYAQSPAHDPTGPDSGKDRVIRGGTWNFRPLGARSAERNKTEPDSRNCSAGFRVVRTQ